MAEPPKKKRKLNLPPPSDIIDHFHDPNEGLSDFERTKKFKGRKRNQQHVPGNYPTHVFIPITLQASSKIDRIGLKIIYNLIQRKNKEIQNLQINESISSMLAHSSFKEWKKENINKKFEFHISLSRLSMLRKDQISPFSDKIINIKFKEKFTLEFRNFVILPNDGKDTYFLAISSSDDCLGYQKMLDLFVKVDEIMENYNLQKYYEEKIPHFSIAWSLDCDRHQNIEYTELDDYFETKINSICCKIGNKLFVND